LGFLYGISKQQECAAHMSNFFRILAGDWSCRVHEPTARDSYGCGSTVGFYNWKLLAQVFILFMLVTLS